MPAEELASLQESTGCGPWSDRLLAHGRRPGAAAARGGGDRPRTSVTLADLPRLPMVAKS